LRGDDEDALYVFRFVCPFATSIIVHLGACADSGPNTLDVPTFKYEVDCTYLDTDRYVSLDVRNVRKCVARWRARRDHGVVPLSLHFSCN